MSSSTSHQKPIFWGIAYHSVHSVRYSLLSRLLLVYSRFLSVLYYTIRGLSPNQLKFVYNSNHLCYRKSRNRQTVLEKGFLDLIVWSYVLSTFVVLPAIILYTNWFVSQISDGFAKGMKDKLRKYSSNKNEREVFNNLQFEYQCCGAQSYEDWNLVEGFANDDERATAPKSLPFSCCKTNVLRFCFNTELSATAKLETLNTRGCAKYFHEFIANRIYIAIILWISILSVHFLSTPFFQYWRSSTQSAIKSGHPKSKGEGWLWLPFVGVYEDIVKDFKTKQRNRRRVKNTDEAKRLIAESSEDSPPESPIVSTANRYVRKIGDKFREKQTGPTMRTMTHQFVDIPEAPVSLVSGGVPTPPSLSPRYSLLAPELSNRMTRNCTLCRRYTFPTGTHVCLPDPKDLSVSMVAITDEDLTGAEDSDSSGEEYQKNYKTSPAVSKLNEKNTGSLKLPSKAEPKKVIDKKYTTTEEDTDNKLGALKRKYRERYFILKEIR